MSKFNPVKPEKIVISLRIDTNLLNDVENLSQNVDISRNEFIIQSIKFAIDNMPNSL